MTLGLDPGKTWRKARQSPISLAKKLLTLKQNCNVLNKHLRLDVLLCVVILSIHINIGEEIPTGQLFRLKTWRLNFG